MRHVNISSSPPPWWPRITAMWKMLHRVAVPTCYPLIDACIAVHSQEALMSTPHFHRWMMTPPMSDTLERPPNLIRLHPLLTQATIIQRPHTGIHVWVRKKGHHLSSLMHTCQRATYFRNHSNESLGQGWHPIAHRHMASHT